MTEEQWWEIRERAKAALASAADVKADLAMRQERTARGEDPEEWQPKREEPKKPQPPKQTKPQPRASAAMTSEDREWVKGSLDQLAVMVAAEGGKVDDILLGKIRTLEAEVAALKAERDGVVSLRGRHHVA